MLAELLKRKTSLGISMESTLMLKFTVFFLEKKNGKLIRILLSTMIE
jgi:hypothetical protein